MCIGVVKVSELHEKIPTQHGADLTVLEGLGVAKQAFFKEGGQEPKEIECIRVNGRSDEGPSHVEVQFIWTERHVTKPTKITLVKRDAVETVI